MPNQDNEKKLTLFARANRLRSACEFDKAAGVYESIVAEFPQEAEAYWGLVLCKYGIEYVDDPATGKKIPTCHRSSFESVLDDSNFDQALENADVVARKVYREEAKQIEELRKGIIEVSAKEEPYDIFICYKETDDKGDRTLDSVLAQDIYDALTEKGYRVFFSRITLEDKLGQEYEPYIFAALNSAKILLAVGTDYEYYNAVWVKNEWSRYLMLMAKDRTKHLIPCYKNIDAYDMPKEFAKLQAQDMGKVGAMQDLLRGIEKILPKSAPAAVVREKVIVGGSRDNKIASLLDRGNMALEDGDWDKADGFFEEVLNNDSKNAEAYLGKALAQERCRTMDALVRKRLAVYEQVQPETLSIPERTEHIAQMAEKYMVPGYVGKDEICRLYDFDRAYPSEVSGRQAQYRQEKSWWADHKLLSRVEKFAVGAVAENLTAEKKRLFAALTDRAKKAQQADAEKTKELENAYAAAIQEADRKAEKCYNDGLARKEADYQSWLEDASREYNPHGLIKLALDFDGLGDFKDSKALAEYCRKRAEEERKKVEAEKVRQIAIAKQKEKAITEKKKRMAIIAAVAVAIAIVAVLFAKMVILPRNAYQQAEALLVSGQYDEADITHAALLFGKAGTYSDAEERSRGLWNRIASRDTISAGFAHTAGLKAFGTVVSVGRNFDGQCNVSDWKDIIAVSAGELHTVGLKADGTVVVVGRNEYGQCNVSHWKDIVAISTGYCHTVGLKADGTVVIAGRNKYGQCNVSNWKDIVAISAGAHHTVGLKADGTVVAVGSNEDHQCNVSDWKDIVAVSAGDLHTVGLKADGTVVAVGSNYNRQCNVSDWKDIVAVSAGGWHTVGLKTDGTVVAVGSNVDGQCNVSNWKDIAAISAGGYNYTVGVKENGTVIAVGMNANGQCDVIGWNNIALPTK